MTDKKDAFDGLLKFTASVSAKYIPILAAFCPDIEFETARGIFIEPAEEGVILVVTNGHALCAFHDIDGQATGPVRFLLPPRIVDACRAPAMPPLYDCNGDDWRAKPPAWMTPGKLYLHTVACYVYPAEQPTHLEGWNAEMGAHFASSMIETGNVWRETDYRVLGDKHFNWRKAFEGPRKHATAPISLNVKTQSLFSGLADLADGGELLTYEVGDPNEAVIVRSKKVPEFIGAIMPTRVICDDPLPDWVRSAPATPTAATPTPTPEELAVKLTDVNEIAMFYDPSDAVGLALDAATMIRTQVRQIEALRAENERLTKDVERLLSAAGRMSYHPDACPITGRPFFMVIDGKATYGGPFDSYTIPRREDDGSLTCEQYDHDRGGWVEDIGLWLHVVSEEDLAERDEKLATAEAALAASQERERGMREAARPVADAFSALSAGWMGEVPDEQRLIAPDITVGQMRQFCAALQPQETADVR